MRWERLILSSRDTSVTLRFHRRMTVVVGVGPLEREGITSELLGALAGPRPGTNLEVVTDDGRRLALLRPGRGLPDRVLDIETGDECTRAFAAPDGGVDLLAPLGLALSDARRMLRLSSLDVLAPAEERRLITELAGLDQATLWGAAQRLLDAKAALESAAAAVGVSSTDTGVIAAVEERHRAFERAQDRCDAIRHHGIFTGVACALAGIPAMAMDRVAAVPFVAVAAAFTALSVVFRRRMEAARLAEEEALTAAGVSSYGGFLQQRVAALMGEGEYKRRRVAEAAGELKAAEAAWQGLAGEVDVRWAQTRKAAVVAAAEESGDREIVIELRKVESASPRQVAEVVLRRLEELQSIGLAGEEMPLILDEPFEGLQPADVRSLMELLVRVSGHPQLLFLTADPEVARWAEAAAVAGDVGVIAPAPTRASVTAG